MDVASLLPAAPRDTIQEFRPGDTVRVNITIREGDRERVQAFQGVVIRGRHLKSHQPLPGATFTVRRESYGIGVERTFLLCSPVIQSVEPLRRGKVRRARLFYLRGRTGKKARIKEIR